MLIKKTMFALKRAFKLFNVFNFILLIFCILTGIFILDTQAISIGAGFIFIFTLIAAVMISIVKCNGDCLKKMIVYLLFAILEVTLIKCDIISLIATIALILLLVIGIVSFKKLSLEYDEILFAADLYEAFKNKYGDKVKLYTVYEYIEEDEEYVREISIKYEDKALLVNFDHELSVEEIMKDFEKLVKEEIEKNKGYR